MKTIEAKDLKHYVRAMSSLEIAQLTGKEHKNVMADIRNMIKALTESGLEGKLKTQLSSPQRAKTLSGIEEVTYSVTNNIKPYKAYKLNYKHTMILITGYSIQLRALVIDRWLELEEENLRLIQNRTDTVLEFLPMTDAIRDIYIPAQTSVGSKKKAYMHLANLVNKWALGMSASKYKKLNALVLHTKKVTIRNYMTEEELELIIQAEKYIHMLINGFGLTSYKDIKEKLFNIKHN